MITWLEAYRYLVIDVITCYCLWLSNIAMITWPIDRWKTSNYSTRWKTKRHLATARIVLGGIFSSLTAGTVHQPEDGRCGTGGMYLIFKRSMMYTYIYIYIYIYYNHIIYIIYNHIYIIIYNYLCIYIQYIHIHIFVYIWWDIFWLDRSRGFHLPLKKTAFFCPYLCIHMHVSIFWWELQYVWRY